MPIEEWEITMKKSIFLLLSSVLCFPMLSHASCTLESNGSPVSFSEIEHYEDLPVGSVLATGTNVVVFKCNKYGLPSGSNSWLIYLSGTNPNYGPAVLNGVVPTQYAGIGMRFTNHNSATNSSQIMTTSRLNDTSVGRGVGINNNGNDVRHTFTNTFEIVKIGTIDKNISTVSLSSFGMSFRGINQSPSSSASTLIEFSFMPTNITYKGCELSQENKQVQLDYVSHNSFTGINSKRAEQAFNIQLTCDTNTPVKLFFDRNVFLSTGRAILPLSSGSTARGIGIYITDGAGNEIDPQSMVYDLRAQTNIVNLEFKGGYIQTEDIVTPGSADATLIFEIKYY